MLWHTLVVILGLSVFEIISSIDNAIINAHVLKTLPQKYRRIFLYWGILFAVFIVRGILPFLIIWLANPSLGLDQLMQVAFSGDGQIEQYLGQTKSLLLLGGGVYLILVCLGWLFLEEKKYAFLAENFIHKQSVWFYAVSSLFFTLILYLSLNQDPLLGLFAAIGFTAFFITDGFKKNAEEKEQQMLRSSSMSAWSKILYLEVLDASFSIDGVIGAFAFTLSIPLIILGNGLGALVVRQVTIKGIDKISKYAYLKNGAMYSIGMLGLIMVLESFGQEYPFWLAPLNTFLLLSIFAYLSLRELSQVKKRR